MVALLDLLLSPARVGAAVGRSLPGALAELPGLIVDLRGLVRELTRLTGPEGELTAYLRHGAGDAGRTGAARR